MSDAGTKVDEARDHVEKALELLEGVKGDEGQDLEGVRKVLDGVIDLMDVIGIEMGEERPEGDNAEPPEEK